MHLAGFAPDRGKRSRVVHRFDKVLDEIKPIGIKRAAFIPNYYTLPAETGHNSTALERLFENLEREVAPHFWRMRGLAEPGLYPLPAHAREAIAGYVTLLQMRSPTYREMAWRRIGFLGCHRYRYEAKR